MFAELSITSNFTFLTGASHPEDYMARAAELGIGAIAIADVNSVAGIVRAHTEAKRLARLVRERRDWDAAHDPIGPPCPAGIARPPSFPVHHVPRLVPAARLVFRDAPDITALPRDRQGWASLCRLLSRGRLRAEKGSCDLDLSDLLDHAEGLDLICWPEARGWPRGAGGWAPHAEGLTRRFAGHIHFGLAPRYDGRDGDRFAALAGAADALGWPTLVMHHGARRRLADVLTAIR
jgi:DNA polymerase III alpha subunit